MNENRIKGRQPLPLSIEETNRILDWYQLAFDTHDRTPEDEALYEYLANGPGDDE